MHCLERWSSADKRISYFEENFDEWFSQLPEDIHEVVCQLLEMFEYYSQLKVNQYLCDLGFKLDEKEQFNPDATIYTPLPSHKGIANSSYDYLFTYRQLHDVSKYKIALDLDRYIEDILFDNINKTFYSNKTGGEHGLGLIREIYEGLNKLLSADPNYMHQRAKCYIKSAYFEKEQAKKVEYLDKAFRDANVAFQVFNSRYNEYHNEKIFISASHVLYTKALILSHKCYVNGYASVDDNTVAIHTLHDALSSPYNTYAFAKKDTFNYLNVVSKIICETIARKTLVSPDAYPDLEDLFRMISDEDK